MVAGDRDQRIVFVLGVAAFCVATGLRDVVNIWIGTAAAALFCLSSIAVTRGLRFESASSRSHRARSAAIGLGVGVAMSVATWCLYPLSVEAVPAIQAEVQGLYALLRQPPGPVWAFPVLVIVVAAEEAIWRGVGIDILRKVTGPWQSVVISALLYVLPQVALRSPLLVLVALLCGMVWGMLRVRTSSLIAPLVAHLVWDLLVFVMFPVE